MVSDAAGMSKLLGESFAYVFVYECQYVNDSNYLEKALSLYFLIIIIMALSSLIEIEHCFNHFDVESERRDWPL